MGTTRQLRDDQKTLSEVPFCMKQAEQRNEEQRWLAEIIHVFLESFPSSPEWCAEPVSMGTRSTSPVSSVAQMQNETGALLRRGYILAQCAPMVMDLLHGMAASKALCDDTWTACMRWLTLASCWCHLQE